jgi:hypothetical protein
MKPECWRIFILRFMQAQASNREWTRSNSRKRAQQAQAGTGDEYALFKSPLDGLSPADVKMPPCYASAEAGHMGEVCAAVARLQSELRKAQLGVKCIAAHNLKTLC